MIAFGKAFDLSISLPGIIELTESTLLINYELTLGPNTYYLFRSLRNGYDEGVR